MRANCVLCGFVRAEPRAPNPCVCLLTHRLAFQRHPSLPYATKSKIPVEEIVRAQRPPRASRDESDRTPQPTLLDYFMP